MLQSGPRRHARGVTLVPELKFNCGHYKHKGIQAHGVAALPPGKELPMPTEQEAGWTPNAGWMFLEKSLRPLPGIKASIFQPVA